MPERLCADFNCPTYDQLFEWRRANDLEWAQKNLSLAIVPLPEAGAALLFDESAWVNLASPQRTNHILFGDGPTSGGHLWPGNPGKTAFPQNWSADRIMHEVSDIATDPALAWVRQTGPAGSYYTKAGDPARFFVVGERGGVNVKVIVEPFGEGIITGYPVP